MLTAPAPAHTGIGPMAASAACEGTSPTAPCPPTSGPCGLPQPGSATLVQGVAAPQPAHPPHLETDVPTRRPMVAARPHQASLPTHALQRRQHRAGVLASLGSDQENLLHGSRTSGNEAYGRAMTQNPQPDEPRGAQFVDADLRRARFVRSDLSGVGMRGVDLAGADIDAPWLVGGLGQRCGRPAPRRGRAQPPLPRARRPAGHDPDGLRGRGRRSNGLGRRARAGRGDARGTVDVSVDGEWSFAQTLRHLVLATDTWLGRAILGVEQPFHPLGQPYAEYEMDGFDMSIFTASTPRTRKCSPPVRATSPWCATSSRRSRRTCSTRRGRPVGARA